MATFDFKNASTEQLRREYNRIAQEIGDGQFFTKRELHHLPKILGDGEPRAQGRVQRVLIAVYVRRSASDHYLAAGG
jgi:hypothetical protein